MDNKRGPKTRHLNSDELNELKEIIQRIFTQDELDGLSDRLRNPKQEDWTFDELEKLRVGEADYDEKHYCASALRAYPDYGLSIQERLLLALIDAHPTHEAGASEERKRQAREDRLRQAMAAVFGCPSTGGRHSSLRPDDDFARGWISDQLCRRAFQKIQHEKYPDEPKWQSDFVPESPGGLAWSKFKISSLARVAVLKFYGLDSKTPEGIQIWERIRKVPTAPEDESSPKFLDWLYEDHRVDWAVEQARDNKLLAALELLRQIGVSSVPNLPHGSPRDE